jgi:hypothetical protein
MKIRMVVAVLLAFALGATVGPHPVKAQAPLEVYVTKTVLMSYGSSGMGNQITGTQIVGFSCVPADVHADCYVLSTK